MLAELDMAQKHVFAPRRGRGSEYCFRQNLLRVEETPESAHEVTHFFEHCGTPYGCFRTEQSRVCSALFHGFLDSYEGAIATPIYSFAREVLDGDDTTDQASGLCKSFIRPWSQVAYLGQLLDGAVEQSALNLAATRQVLAWFDDYSREVCQSEDPVFVGPPVSRTDEADWACDELPCIAYAMTPKSEVESQVIGALHASETLAALHEGITASFDQPRELDYTILLFECIVRHGIDEFSDQTIEQHLRVPTTCLLLADLALFTPLGAWFSPLRRPGNTWADVHPGHRFLAALRVVQERNLWTNSLDDSAAFCDEICRALDWPEVGEFLEIGAEITNRRFEHHRDAFRIRQHDFTAFYFNQDDALDQIIAAFLGDYMPISEIPGHEATCAFSERRQEYASVLHQLRDCYLINLEHQAMLANVDVTSLLPFTFPFDDYFTNISATADLGSLIGGRYPWLDISRFAL